MHEIVTFLYTIGGPFSRHLLFLISHQGRVYTSAENAENAENAEKSTFLEISAENAEKSCLFKC